MVKSRQGRIWWEAFTKSWNYVQFKWNYLLMVSCARKEMQGRFGSQMLRDTMGTSYGSALFTLLSSLLMSRLYYSLGIKKGDKDGAHNGRTYCTGVRALEMKPPITEARLFNLNWKKRPRAGILKLNQFRIKSTFPWENLTMDEISYFHWLLLTAKMITVRAKTHKGNDLINNERENVLSR